METSAAMKPMPLYESHKRVWALKIKNVLHDGFGTGLEFEEGGFSTRYFSDHDLKNKPVPEAGMYMVQYEDGYISFSPAKQFDEGYTLVGAKKRPTIAELEAILNSEEDAPITIHSDGSITA